MFSNFAFVVNSKSWLFFCHTGVWKLSSYKFNRQCQNSETISDFTNW